MLPKSALDAIADTAERWAAEAYVHTSPATEDFDGLRSLRLGKVTVYSSTWAETVDHAGGHWTCAPTSEMIAAFNARRADLSF